jgi:hypothetical protein
MFYYRTFRISNVKPSFIRPALYDLRYLSELFAPQMIDQA